MARYKDIDPIIDFIEKGLNNPDKTKAFGYDAIEILTEIEYAPTADVVEVRHGNWIDDHCNRFHCSDCGKTYQLGSVQTIYDVKRCWVYCPHCGAKMDKGEEENDGNN